jgi:hypothetical protein
MTHINTKQAAPTIDITATFFEKLYNDNPDEFERNAMAAVVLDYGQHKKWLDLVCQDKPNGRFHLDFNSRARNILFVAFRMYMVLVGVDGSKKAVTTPDWKIMAQICEIFFSKYPDMGNAGDLPDLENEWKEIIKISKSERAVMLIPGMYKLWLTAVRYEKEMSRAENSGEIKRNPNALLKRLLKQASDLDVSDTPKGKTIFSFDEVELATKDDLERLSTGMKALDRALGGGYRKANTYLVLAYTGVGKTTFTIQMLANFCILQNLKGIVISTEETPSSIKLRLISHCCHYDWEHLSNIAGHFDPKKDMPDPKKQAQYKEMKEKMTENLWMIDWTIPDNVDESFEDIIAKFKEAKGQAPDFIILDWLGGALDTMTGTKGTSDEGDKLRHVYADAASQLLQAARKHSICVLYLAQTNRKGVNTPFVSQEHLGESFAPAKGVAAVIGMSAMQNKNISESGGTAELYLPEQILFVGKCRYGKGGAVPFRRNFGMQRMEERK